MTATAAPIAKKRKPITLHGILVKALAVVLAGPLLYSLWIGFSYYVLPLSDRPFHPLHRQLRPAGPIGIGFGIASCVLFALIYVYPIRKKWKWLRERGNTPNWLDFHIVMGLTAPFLVALHSAFKFGGLAGMAFWLMLAVVLSGIAGRYLYAQIPRGRKNAELSLAELHRMSAELSESLRDQHLIAEAVWQPLVAPVRREDALKMHFGRAIWQMLTMDLQRPFQMAALRRPSLSAWERVRSLGGLLASSHRDLEQVVTLARTQSWLTGKICFLDRAGQIFKMWHVVHRPFSSAFLLLSVIHIGMAVWMGFISWR